MKELVLALKNQLWIDHRIGDTYAMINQDGSKSTGWKIAYYPLFHTYAPVSKYRDIEKMLVDFEEPRALVEKPFNGGTDFREVPLRYLTKE